MQTPPVSRGFFSRRRVIDDQARASAGQYVAPNLLAVHAGPTPDTPLQEWTFNINGEVDRPVSGPGRRTWRCRPRPSQPTSTVP